MLLIILIPNTSKMLHQALFLFVQSQTIKILWMIGASLSEYHEFPIERESEATRFIILWITVFGASLILAIRMFYLGIRKIYSS